MATLTPELMGNSLIVMLIGYGIAFLFQLYMLYLNWKQSKVKDTTAVTNDLLFDILKELKELKNIKKRIKEYKKGE